MSVVAVKVEKNKITLAADSFIGFSYDTQLKDKDAKCFQDNGMTVGVVGHASDCTLMRLFCKSHKPSEPSEIGVIDFVTEYIEWAKKKVTDYKIQSFFMFIFDGTAWFVSSDMYVKRIKTFLAMGAGQDMAQTALHLGKSAEEAIDIACEMSVYCEKPINVFEVTL